MYKYNQPNITNFNKDDLFDYAELNGFGEIHLKVDNDTGLRAIIAIHSTKNGPAIGGCRCIEYPSSMAALKDAMRLAKAMSYKAALVGIPYGGAKAVLMKPPVIDDREAYFASLGQFIHELSGRFITAVDVGTTMQDMEYIAAETGFVASTSRLDGRPSVYTARGVRLGIQAAIEFKLRKQSLEGVHVAIQGCGKVGFLLAKELHALGCKLTVTDINQDAIDKCLNEFKAQAVEPEAIYEVECDVFSPCALGATVNSQTIEQIKAPIIAGSANNQLANEKVGALLHSKNILYAPDYIINAAGLIYVAGKYDDSPPELINEHVTNINSTLLDIFKRSEKENLPTSEIADAMAVEKL